jgi:hypothetical protein
MTGVVTPPSHVSANFFRRELFVPVARHFGCPTQSVRPNKDHSALEKERFVCALLQGYFRLRLLRRRSRRAERTRPSTIEEIRELISALRAYRGGLLDGTKLARLTTWRARAETRSTVKPLPEKDSAVTEACLACVGIVLRIG